MTPSGRVMERGARSWARGAAMLLMCAAVTARGADLLRTYHEAQRHDATYEAAQAAFAAAAQKLPQARAGLLPTIGVTGSDGVAHAVTAFGDLSPVDRRIRTWTWALRLDQPVFHLDKVYAYREATFQVARARLRLARARSELILRVAKAYFAVLVAREGVAAARARASAMRQQLARASHRFRAGIAAVTDVDEANAHLQLARSQALAAAEELEDKRAELQKITGRWPSRLAALRGAAVIPRPVPADRRAWLTRARESNLAVLARQAALSAAGKEIGRRRAGHLPKVDLTASYGGNYSSDNLTSPARYATRHRSWRVGVRVALPLYAGGGTRSRVAQAIAERDRARWELQAARRRAATDARQAYAAIRNGVSRIKALRASLCSAKSAVKGNEAGYRMGLRINTDVLNAQQQLYKTLHELAKARYGTLFQGLKLKAAAGNLSEEDLRALDSLLAKSGAGANSRELPYRPAGVAPKQGTAETGAVARTTH